MSTFNLQIITPDTTLYNGEVQSAIFPGIDGSFEILHDHAPFLTQIKSGEITITDASKAKTTLPVSTGFFEFKANRALLLTFKQI